VTARLVDIGKALQSRIRDFFDSPLDATATPLELLRAVLHDLEMRIEPIGRGRRVFPYNHVHVRIGPVAAERASLTAVFDELEKRFSARLLELQCTGPASLDMRASFLKRTPVEWRPGQMFTIDCRSDAEPSMVPGAESRPRRVRLSIIKGAATRDIYTFSQAVISIGRTAEPTDERGRIRRNDVVFVDSADDLTQTVGRAHASLRLDQKTNEYRLFNDGSSNPTFVVRGGKTIEIPPRDPRGARVCSGDEIQLGRAVIRLALDT
jgi:FHA domain